jgi:DNA-binding NtrC family response regulator
VQRIFEFLRNHPLLKADPCTIFEEINSLDAKDQRTARRERFLQQEKSGMGEPGPEKSCVLLVDDNPWVLEVQAEMIERLGYSVVMSKDALESLSLFREDPYRFDLVMTDEIMPKMYGSEMVARMKFIRPDIPIMIVTGGLDLKSTRERADLLRIPDIYLKPFTMTRLAAAMEQVLHSTAKI